jgi:peptidoglycan-N-acetylglucosamine deacetylase
MRTVWKIIVIWLYLASVIAGHSALAATVYEQLQSGQRVQEEKEYTTPELPTVYLSFDDGPSVHTPQILDILKQEGVQATFFVLGEHAERHPEWVKRITDEGHALGNHTFNHEYRELYSSYEQFWGQVNRTEETIQAITGLRTSLLRAPGGTYTNFDPFYFYYLDQAGYTVYDWNVDSGDARRANVPTEEIVRNVTGSKLHHEAHVLMHDGPGHQNTVEALPEIIRHYREQGYVFATLDMDVKPVMFSYKNSRWNRPMVSTQQFERSLALSEARAGSLPVVVKSPPSFVLAEEIVLEEAPAPDLTLKLPNRLASLEASSYELKNGRLIVPLRVLVEEMGGRVTWDGERRTAIVEYGAVRLEYRLGDMQLVVLRNGRVTEVIYLPEMALKEGSVYVPLRDTVERLGERIEDYELGEDRSEVNIVPRLSLYRV